MTDSPNENIDITIGEATPVMKLLSDDYDQEDTANDSRARSGWDAVMAYTNKAYKIPSPEPVAQGIEDLLGDLQHTCKHLNLDFNDLLQKATATFEDELINPLG